MSWIRLDLVSHFVLVYAIWSKMASNPAERKLKTILAVIKNVKIISVSTPKVCLGIEKPKGIEKLGVLMSYSLPKIFEALISEPARFQDFILSGSFYFRAF